MLSKIKLLVVALLAICDLCLAQIPILNSNPGITNKVIYLDFDGQKVTGTAWNGGNTINAQPSTMSAANIELIWKRVREDYRPFDVNITTDSLRFNAAPSNKRMRVVVTPTSAWYTSPAGGVAFVGSFIWGGNPGTPCWIFENQLGYNPKNMAEATAHEVGHTLTLKHQSTYNSTCSKTAEYNPGLGSSVNSWAPIMGVGYSRNVTIWHSGTSTDGCNVIQNDHGNSGTGLTSPGYLSFIPDDVGNTLNTAKVLNLNTVNLVDSGIISEPKDIDVYQFTICNNRYVSINVKPWALDTVNYPGADLDVRLFLYDAVNNILAVDTPLSKLHARVSANLTPGTYYFTVDGGRSPNYTDYGSLGKYYISLKATNPPALANSIVTATNICAGQTTTLNYTSNGVPTQWQWTVSGPSSATFAVQTPTIIFSAGIHTVNLLATSSTSLSCPTSVTLNVGTLPTVTVSTFAGILCPGRNATLTAGGASSYTWLPVGFNGTTQALTPFVTTTYTVIGSDGTCLNSAVTTVTVSPDFTVSAAVSATQICAGQSVTLTVSGISNFTINPVHITSSPYIFTPDDTTNLGVIGKSGTCTKTKGITINVYPHFDVNVNASDTSICLGQSVTLMASGASSYTYNPGGLTGGTVVVAPNANTIYTVTGRRPNLCREDTTITIGVKICDETGIQKLAPETGIRIYPNPSYGSLIIALQSPGKKAEILNALGQIVYSKELSETENHINTESWAPGIYFVKLYENQAELHTEKIVVE